MKKPFTLAEGTANLLSEKPLRQVIQKALEDYFSCTDKTMPPKEVYRMVMDETEIPLLQATLSYTEGNQCKAAEILGISRNTLRKKLEQHNLSKA